MKYLHVYIENLLCVLLSCSSYYLVSKLLSIDTNRNTTYNKPR